MVDISFEINGRKVNPKSFGDAITQAVLSQVIDQVKNKVGSIRCPEHGKSPKIICKGRSIDDLSFQVTGCCDAIIESVRSKLN